MCGVSAARLRAGGEAHRGQHLYLAVPSAPGTSSGKPSRVRHGRRPARAWCQRQALEGGGRAGPSLLGPGAPGEAVLLLRDKPHHLAPPPSCFWPEVLFDLRPECFSWWQKWLRALSASQDGRGVQGKSRVLPPSLAGRAPPTWEASRLHRPQDSGAPGRQAGRPGPRSPSRGCVASGRVPGGGPAGRRAVARPRGWPAARSPTSR